jgi:Transglycosylase SLT domain
MRLMRALALALPCLFSAGLALAADDSTQCETAISAAEYTGNLPPRMMLAIAKVESGRYDEAAKTVRPWPWTINVEGEGHYYASKADAIGAVRAFQMRGVKSIDVGCMQVNLMYHPTAFSSLDEAFEPSANTAYAAKFLNRLHAPGDDWAKAIGAYHSETPSLGDPYRAMVMQRWNGPNLTFASKVQPVAYRAFKPATSAYRDFAQVSRAYGSFASATR